MRITTLAGGVGAAKFIRGLARRIAPENMVVVVNTGDDDLFYGLYVSPDIDTVTYTLAGVVNRAQGWGRADESFATLEGSAIAFTVRTGSRSAIATSQPTSTAPTGCAPVRGCRR